MMAEINGNTTNGTLPAPIKPAGFIEEVKPTTLTTQEPPPPVKGSVASSIYEDEKQPQTDVYSIFEDDIDGHSRADTLESTGLIDLPVNPRHGGGVTSPGLGPRKSYEASLSSSFSAGRQPQPQNPVLRHGPTSGPSSVATSRPSTAHNHPASGAITLYNANQYISVQNSTARAIDKLAQLQDSNKSTAGNVVSFANQAAFAKFVGRRRIKHMPHRGSILDRVLKRAELFSLCVDAYARILSGPAEMNAALAIMSCMQLMLECLDRRQEDDVVFAVVEKIFLELYQLGKPLDRMVASYAAIQSPSVKLTGALDLAFVQIIDFCLNTAVSCKRREPAVLRLVFFSEFDQHFGDFIKTFYIQQAIFLNLLWEAWAGASTKSGIDIKILRKFLGGHGRSSGHMQPWASATTAEQFTFEWFPPKLDRFLASSDDVLLVSGPSGSGKSTLLSFMMEYLSVSNRGKSKVLCVSIGLKYSTVTLLKTLLLQLLDSSVGDDVLVEVLWGAYEKIEKQHADNPEALLWRTFAESITRQTSDTVIVIDGLEKIDGGDKVALYISEEIRKICVQRHNLRCVLFSRPFYPGSALPHGFCGLPIDPTVTRGDINRYIEIWISRSGIFLLLKAEERRALIKLLCDMNIGTFVDAKLLLQLLERELNYEAMIRVLQGTRQTSTDMIRLLCAHINYTKKGVLEILSLLLVSQRSLKLKEVKTWLEIALQTGSAPQIKDIREYISNAIGFVVEVRGGMVDFVHPSIKEHLLSANRFPVNIRDVHRDILLRCLTYIKRNLRDLEMDPSVGDSPASDALRTFQRTVDEDSVLEYALQYYLVHFRASSLFQASGDHKTPPEFRACFPDSVLLAFMERIVFEASLHLAEDEESHRLALHLRKSTFGSHGKSTIQSYINVGRCRQKLSKPGSAADSFFEAWTLCQLLFEKYGRPCIAIAKAYIEIVNQNRALFDNDVDIRLEKVYVYMWTTYKHIHGEAHEDSVSSAEILARFYVKLRKLKQAADIYHDVFYSCLKFYGALHPTTIRLSGLLVDILKQLGREDECIDIWYIIFCNAEESLDAWDRQRIDHALRMVRLYELQGSLKKAEEILRNLQTALAAAAQTSTIDQVHSAYIQMTAELARFFSRHERKADSSKLLLEIWRVYERFLDGRHAHDTELLGGLKTVGDILVELDMLSDAERVLQRLLQFYKDNMQGSSQAAILIILALSRCHQKQRDDSREEQTLRDIFEVLITQSVIDGTTTSICIELASFYNRISRWSEAVDVTSRLLIRLWDAVLRESRPFPTLPKYLPDDAIKLATNLASYYMKMSRATEAEGIYQFVFLSCRANLPLSDPRILNAVDQLVKFYETTKVIDKAISVLIQLKDDARAALGTGHKVYIEIYYRLARLYEAHHRPEAGKAYGDIFKDCGGHHSHGGLAGDRTTSLEAILALIRLYEKQRQVSESITWYETLWRSFQEHGQDTGLDMKTYFDIFVRHITTLEQTKGLVEAIRLAEGLRSVCIFRYGGQHIYTIRAILELAQMLEKDESHHEEATRLYEMIIRLRLEDYPDQIEMERMILISRERLARLFSCHNHSMPSAELIWVEIWEDSKKRYGCSHAKTLDYLSKMIAFFAMRKTAESSALALKMLRTAVMEILEQERDDRRLFDVAAAVCEMYVLLQSQDAAFELLQEIRRDISSSTSGRSTLDRRSFIFVLALEELLRGNKSSTLFGDVSRDLMTETTLYESWMRALQYGGSLEARLSIGARLVAFLDSKRRTMERNRVEEELWTIFYKELKAESARTGILWDLFQICLKEVKKVGPALPLVEATTNAVRTYYLQGNFRQSFDLATWLVGFVEQKGGWNSKDLGRLGLKLAFLLAGRESRASRDMQAPDRQLDADMSNLSKRILVQIFKSDSLPKDMDFGSMDLEDIRLLIRMLSAETRLLEGILRKLWSLRTLTAWEEPIIVPLGEVLCEVLFAEKHTREAIDLAEDIYYNLNDFYGCLYPGTLNMAALLSSFYTALGKPSDAIPLHRDILLHITTPDVDAGSQDVARIAFEHARLLKLACQRSAALDSAAPIQLTAIEQAVATCKTLPGGGAGDWSELGPVAGWISGGLVPQKSAYGFWERPDDWIFGRLGT